MPESADGTPLIARDHFNSWAAERSMKAPASPGTRVGIAQAGGAARVDSVLTTTRYPRKAVSFACVVQPAVGNAGPS